jgi:DNA gyrase subunit A
MTDGNSEIMMAIKSGRAIRFPEDKVRSTGRGAIGVGGIEVDEENDEVIGMICVNKDDAAQTVLVVSENGYGKRTPVEDYRITNRGGKGVKTINVTEKTGQLVGIVDVNETNDLLITCKSGITLRTSVASIKEAGRATQGVKLIRLDDNDAIAAISKIQAEEEEIIDAEAVVEGDSTNPTDENETAAPGEQPEQPSTDEETTDNNN